MSSRYVNNAELPKQSVEEEQKLRDIAYRMVVFATTPIGTPNTGSNDTFQRKLNELASAITDVKDQRLRIWFREDTQYAYSSSAPYHNYYALPATLARDIIIAYYDLIVSWLVKDIDALKDMSVNRYRCLPINSRYFVVIYSITTTEGDLRDLLRYDSNDLLEKALPYTITIECQSVIHELPMAKAKLGADISKEHTFYLYHYEYDHALLEKADRIANDLASWYTFVVGAGKSSKKKDT
ncbi:MAG: hypothetical protein QXM92_03210 [Candidatus Anstonellales archaeon]